MTSPLTRKLMHGAFLEVDDCERLDAVIAGSRRVSAHVDIIKEGDAPENVHLVLEGWAYRYKTLPNGRRQIMAFLIPGDFCDLHIAVLGRMDHGIATLTPTTVVDIPKSTVHELTFNHPRIARALWWATLVDEAILREWLVSMGQRSANRQMSHLFCELFTRLTVVGLTTHDSFPLPMSQEELGDALGLSAVHVNRTLQYLRDQRLITLQHRRVGIPDFSRLQEYSGFDELYLHLNPQHIKLSYAGVSNLRESLSQVGGV